MKTAMSSHKDRRNEIRYSMFGEFPGKLLHQASQDELSFLPIDISHKGLGLLVIPCPSEGSQVRVEFADSQIPSLIFVCRHVHEVLDEPLLGFENMRRCGLELAEDQQASLDLIEFFARFDSVMIGD